MAGARSADGRLPAPAGATGQKGLLYSSRPLLPLLSRPVVSLTPPLALPHAAPHVQATKANLRAEFAEEWAAFAAPEAEGAWQMLSSPAVVEALGAVLQRLSGGRKPGGGGGQAQSRL